MDIVAPVPRPVYPPTLTEIERVEIASALSFHFDAHPDCRNELEDQYTVVCVVVERMIRRRAGVA